MFSRVNVGCGPAEERLLLTGLHAVADIYCENCHTTLGWKYVSAAACKWNGWFSHCCSTFMLGDIGSVWCFPHAESWCLFWLVFLVNVSDVTSWQRANSKWGHVCAYILALTLWQVVMWTTLKWLWSYIRMISMTSCFLFCPFSVLGNGYLKQNGTASNLSWKAQLSSAQIFDFYPYFIIFLSPFDF